MMGAGMGPFWSLTYTALHTIAHSIITQGDLHVLITAISVGICSTSAQKRELMLRPPKQAQAHRVP